MTDLTILPEQGLSQHSGATAAAQHSMAQIQARTLVAINRPRDFDLARTKIMKDCERPGFAKAATYTIPNRGSGLTIKFAESILRNWGNLYCESITVDDNEEALTVRVSVTDLESNACLTRDVTVEKTVERHSQPKGGNGVVGTRYNTQGKTLYIIRATSDDVLGKVNSNISKALRTLLLKFVPFDVLEDCEELIKSTVRARDAKDPDAAKNQIVDGFSRLNVTPADLADFLGKGLARLQPADLEELRGIWTAMKNGETTWDEIMEEKKPTTVVEGVTNAMDAKASQAEVAGELRAAGGPLADPLAMMDAEAEADMPTRGDTITDIESLGLSEQQITSAASDLTGQVVLDYLLLTDAQLVDLLSRLKG